MSSYGTLPQTQSTVYDRTDTGYSITITKTCLDANRESETPAIGSAHPSQTAYSLKTSKQEPIGGGLTRITLTYVATADELPAKSYVEQSSYVEVPIQEHPNFSDWLSDWDEEKQAFRASSSKAGITSYVKGSTTVTVTEYFSSKPSSPYEDVGTLESPGAGYGSAAKWLVIGATRQKVGNYWAVEKVFLYSAKEYDTDVYPD